MTIEASGVVFRGFTVRNSGRQVTEEAAGIKVTGNGHRIEANDVHDVYFGVHVGDGGGHVVEDNRIAPGEQHGARPGHGISVWHVRDSADYCATASPTPATASICRSPSASSWPATT